MNINVELQRKPEDFRLDNCVIDVIEEIPHESFETFQNYPTACYGAITNSLHRLPEDTKDERHCIRFWLKFHPKKSKQFEKKKEESSMSTTA